MTNTNFKRGISNIEFINELNMLKQNPDTFWSKILKDDRFIVAIRDNYLNVYFYGQSVAKIEYKKRKECLVYSTHKKYLVLDGTGYQINNGEELANINPIKQIKNYCSLEKKCSYNYLLKSKRCIDVEVTFSGVKKSIDFVLLSKNGELEFYEAKHASNSELVSKSTPKVFVQTDDYINLLKEHKQNVINSYKVVLQNYKDLGIKTPNVDIESASKIRYGEPLLRLIIFGKKENKDWESQKSRLEEKYGNTLIWEKADDRIRYI